MSCEYAVSSILSSPEISALLPDDTSLIFYVTPECDVMNDPNDLSDNSSREIAEEYKKKYGNNIDHIAGFPCASMQFLFIGMKESTSLSTKSIFSELEKHSNIDTVVGRVSFEERYSIFKMAIMQFTDKKHSVIVTD